QVKYIISHSVDNIFIGFNLSAESIDLGKPCNSGFNQVADHKFINLLSKTFGFFNHMRSWPNYRHISFEHVPELRKFINTGFSQEGSYFSNSGVIFSYLMQVGGLIWPHRTELVTIKLFIVQPVSLLFKENVSFAFCFNEYG